MGKGVVLGRAALLGSSPERLEVHQVWSHLQVGTSKLCQEWGNLRENRLSRTIFDLSPLTHQIGRSFWIYDAQLAYEIRSNSDFTPCVLHCSFGKEWFFVHMCPHKSEVCESSGSSTSILNIFTQLLNFSGCCSALLQCFQNKEEHRKQVLKFQKTWTKWDKNMIFFIAQLFF